MTWFGGSKMSEESNVIQRLLRVGKKRYALLLTHSLTYSLTHLLTHSLTHLLTCAVVAARTK